MRQSSGAAFGFVPVTVALDLLAMGITVPVLPQLILRLLKGDTEAAVLGFGALGAVWALMQWAPDGAVDIALANQYVGGGAGVGRYPRILRKTDPSLTRCAGVVI